MDKQLREDLGEDYDARSSLTPEERAASDRMRRNMTEAVIRSWKVNGKLHRDYGGRIIYQQLGPEPLDAYREYLEERDKAGDFEILNPDMKPAFWRYFTDEAMHDFMEPGGEDEAKALSTPPWEKRE